MWACLKMERANIPPKAIRNRENQENYDMELVVPVPFQTTHQPGVIATRWALQPALALSSARSPNRPLTPLTVGADLWGRRTQKWGEFLPNGHTKCNLFMEQWASTVKLTGFWGCVHDGMTWLWLNVQGMLCSKCLHTRYLLCLEPGE